MTNGVVDPLSGSRLATTWQRVALIDIDWRYNFTPCGSYPLTKTPMVKRSGLVDL